jgi:hypothetical protein|tara:strand:+ start:599 stop:985 length:387 start_codon:yes stop_codon:yes gene_type:complete
MARITRNELESSVSSTKTEQQASAAIPNDERVVTAYTTGLEVVEESSNKAYAKKVSIEGQDIYYVKRDKYGSLYNPQGMYSERNQTKLNRYGAKWSFMEVSKSAYDKYLKFLDSKNEAWLSNAERELA